MQKNACHENFTICGSEKDLTEGPFLSFACRLLGSSYCPKLPVYKTSDCAVSILIHAYQEASFLRMRQVMWKWATLKCGRRLRPADEFTDSSSEESRRIRWLMG